MKKGTVIAIASDFHSNATATKAFLALIKEMKVDQLICLGDYVSDFPLPQETLSPLYEIQKEMPCLFLRGNREEYFLTPHDDWRPSSQNGSLYHTKEHLTPYDLSFFASLPITMEVTFPYADGFTIAHGSPSSPYEHLYPNKENTIQYLEQSPFHYLIVGHTHEPSITYHQTGCFVNPGSIGLPINGTPMGQFATLTYDGNKWLPQLHCFAYALETEKQRFFKSHFFSDAQDWAVASYLNLTSGKDEHCNLLEMAQALAKGNGLSDDVFHQAAIKLHFPDWHSFIKE